jgi:hypothetical protein
MRSAADEGVPGCLARQNADIISVLELRAQDKDQPPPSIDYVS